MRDAVLEIKGRKRKLFFTIPMLIIGLLLGAMAWAAFTNPDPQPIGFIAGSAGISLLVILLSAWQLNHIFGPAHVRIDQDGITIRQHSKEPILWESIHNLEIKKNRFFLSTTDESVSDVSENQAPRENKHLLGLEFRQGLEQGQNIIGIEYANFGFSGKMPLAEPDPEQFAEVAKLYLSSGKVACDPEDRQGSLMQDYHESIFEKLKENMTDEQKVEFEKKRDKPTDTSLTGILGSITRILKDDRKTKNT